mmetsp:Transcript_57764/g.126608  ORF Transcript_57764/g.126608 Transcript_57764/m.126608 type:complete len:346 (-) Transcript_57764:169-1206(-)
MLEIPLGHKHKLVEICRGNLVILIQLGHQASEHDLVLLGLHEIQILHHRQQLPNAEDPFPSVTEVEVVPQELDQKQRHIHALARPEILHAVGKIIQLQLRQPLGPPHPAVHPAPHEVDELPPIQVPCLVRVRHHRHAQKLAVVLRILGEALQGQQEAQELADLQLGLPPAEFLEKGVQLLELGPHEATCALVLGELGAAPAAHHRDEILPGDLGTQDNVLGSQEIQGIPNVLRFPHVHKHLAQLLLPERPLRSVGLIEAPVQLLIETLNQGNKLRVGDAFWVVAHRGHLIVQHKIHQMNNFLRSLPGRYPLQKAKDLSQVRVADVQAAVPIVHTKSQLEDLLLLR